MRFTKNFQCDCHYPGHVLRIEIDTDYDLGKIVTVSIGTDTCNSSLLEKIKAIWNILRGHDHIYSEVVLRPKDYSEFSDFAKMVQADRNAENHAFISEYIRQVYNSLVSGLSSANLTPNDIVLAQGLIPVMEQRGLEVGSWLRIIAGGNPEQIESVQDEAQKAYVFGDD